jgi:hypothetical protein
VTLAKLIEKSAMGGGVMLMGLSLLSQPAQALNWNLSYNSPTSGAVNSVLTTDGTTFQAGFTYTISAISGTVNGNTITGLVSSFPDENGGTYSADNQFSWDGGTGIFLSFDGIAFQDDSTPSARINNLFNSFGLRNYSINADGTDLQLDQLVSSSSLTPVPWETDALPVVGSTILFAGGLWAKRKFAKPLQK